MTRHTPPHPRDIRDVAATAPAHRRRDRYEHHGACDANRSRCHVFRPSSMRASRRALGASLRCARASVGLDFRDRARGWWRRASPRARADARISSRGRRSCAVEFSWRRSVRCGRETRRRATRCGRGSAIVDCAGVNGSRTRHTAWGVLAVVRPWVGACAGLE